MARLGCGIGVLLMLAAFVALFAVVVLPVIPGIGDSPFLWSIQGLLHCAAGQTFEQEISQSNPLPGTTYYQAIGYCVSDEGVRTRFTQEQDDRRLIVGALLFGVPFIVGLFLAIASLGSMTRRAVRQRYGAIVDFQFPEGARVAFEQIARDTGLVIGRSEDGVRVNMPGVSEPMVVTRADRFVSQTQSQPQGDLASRLRQLEDARNQGLISAEEHERLRKAILDELAGN